MANEQNAAITDPYAAYGGAVAPATPAAPATPTSAPVTDPYAAYGGNLAAPAPGGNPDPYAAYGGSAAPQAPPAAPAQAKPDTGIIAGVKRNTVDALTGLYHAFSDPATDQEKAELLQKVREQNAGGDKVPESIATNPSRATLALHRIVDAPADMLAKRGKDEVGVAQDLINNHQYWRGGNMYLSGLTDRLLSAIPVAGPALNSIAERMEGSLGPMIDAQGKPVSTENIPAERKDFSGGLTDVGSLVAMEHAPAIAKAGGEVIGKVTGPAGKITDAIAEKMYQSTLKPSPKSYTPEEVQSMVHTGLENKIPVSKAGVDKLNGLVSDLNDKITAEIKAGSDAGATVNKFDVASRLGGTAKKFATQVNPEADLAAVGESGNEFLKNQPNEISASDAQKLKQGTYKQLGDKAYGEMSTATKESQKALARGIKEELAEQFPEIANMNAKESKLLGLDDALETAVNRTRNHNIISLGTKIASPIVGGVVGGGEGAAAGTGLALMYEILSHPAIQSRIAIGISRASKIPFSEALAKVGVYTAALGPVSAQQTDNNQESESQSEGESTNPQ